jgi:hypothetical protein
MKGNCVGVVARVHFQHVLLALACVGGSDSAAAQGSTGGTFVVVPSFDTAAYCGNGPDSVTCVAIEQDAKAQLAQLWPSLSAIDRHKCEKHARNAGPGGSYNVALGCASSALGQ